MGRIRGSNTTPERAVRSALHRIGNRFRLDTGRSLPGKPDVVLPIHKTAIFVHGCFWHRHKRCVFAYTPKSRIDFWTAKFTDNVERDARVARKLRRRGWSVLTIWECQTRSPAKLTESLARKLSLGG